MGPDSPKQQAAFSPRQLGVGQPKKEATLSNMPEKKKKEKKEKTKKRKEKKRKEHALDHSI